MIWRYKFDENMSNENKLKMIRIDYIHELLKKVYINDYNLAKLMYKKKRKRGKNL